MRKHLSLSFGLLLLVAGGANAQLSIPTDLDHFNCYITPAQPNLSQLAFLQDQFDVREKSTQTVYDIKMQWFCNPAKKTLVSATGIPSAAPILHTDAHLAMYQITPEATVTPRSVPINNQFGAQTLITGEAEMLAVPTGKTPISANGGPVNLPAIPDPKELDHFKCYSASGPAINKTVLLNDQFFVDRAETATVLTPRYFCNPVTKSVLPATCPVGQFCPLSNTPINHPADHLACYIMRVATPFQTVVAYNNQFVAPGTLPTVPLRNPALLCVPSSKSEGWIDIPSPTGSPTTPNGRDN